MKIFVTAKPKAKKEGVEKIDDTHFIVRIRAVPQDGKANEAVITSLAAYFGIPAMRVKISSVFSSRRKIVELL